MPIDPRIQVLDDNAALRALASPENYIYKTLNGNEWLRDLSDTTSVDDNATIIVTNDDIRMKRNFRGIYRPEDFGAVGDGIIDDSVAFQKIIDFMDGIGGTIFCDSQATYKIDTPFEIYNIGTSMAITIQGNNCHFLGTEVIKRRPIDQDDAMRILNGTIRVYECFFNSGTINTGTAIEICATCYSEVARCTFIGYEVSHHFKFGLWSRSTSNQVVQCLQGCTFDIGDWAEANNVNSQSNVSTSFMDTFYGVNEESIGFKIRGSSECVIEQATSQGSAIGWHIYYDSDLSTVVRDSTVNGLHAESLYTKYGIIYLRPTGGTVNISRIFQQGSAPYTLFLDNQIHANPTVNISRINHTTELKLASNSNQTMWIFFEMPAGWNYLSNFIVTSPAVAPYYLTVIDPVGRIFSLHLEIKSANQLDLISEINSIRLIGYEDPKIRTIAIGPTADLFTEQRYGTTSERPVLMSTQVGSLYFDTTVQALLVWNGTSWLTV